MNSVRELFTRTYLRMIHANNVFLEFMDMVGQQFDEIWTYTKSITDLNVRERKVIWKVYQKSPLHLR